MRNILGHHHISMITKNAQQNNYFYETILGMRRVKISVNQDDPTMYHLFFGDLTGSPGTGLTFFEMPFVGRTYRGANAYTKIGLIVPSLESLTYWKERLTSFKIEHSERNAYLDRPSIHFADPDGLQLALIYAGDRKLANWQAWPASPVPQDMQIYGIGPVEIKVRRLAKIVRTFTEIFQYDVLNETSEQIVIQAAKNDVFSEKVLIADERPSERPGRGSIHHLALRVQDSNALLYYRDRLRERGFVTTDVIDRYYFQSIYFRESNGLVFEIATDGPGFTVDEKVENLGKKLSLPPFLQHKREEIEQKLPPLTGV